jgi:microsomal dipeptidase-like Zn-dependent dipeptidase
MMQMIFEALRKEGFSEDQIEKIAYTNVLRVIKETL